MDKRTPFDFRDSEEYNIGDDTVDQLTDQDTPPERGGEVSNVGDDTGSSTSLSHSFGVSTGYIKLFRQIRENPFYKNSVAFHIWIECLLRSTYVERSFYSKRVKISLKEGQFLMGYREFSNIINCSVSTIKYWLDQFCAERMIERQTNAKGTIITILNWNIYQIPERFVVQGANTLRTLCEPNKKGNKEKNDKNPERGAVAPPTPFSQNKEFFEKGEIYKKVIFHFSEKLAVGEADLVRELDNFINYWKERNKSGTQERWELEKTFELKRRLATWFTNARKWQPKQPNLTSF